MSQKPFAPAAEQNRHDILAVLKHELRVTSRLLELASGTGQHACHFAQGLPHVRWQPSELADKLLGIELWISEADCQNIEKPIALDIRNQTWPALSVGACYAANTLHIISWESVKSLFAGCGSVLLPGGKLLVYGPFSINGEHTAPSNQRFDQSLKAADPLSGVRDTAELNQLAVENGFGMARLIEMPVNNFIAVWEKTA